jgi:hypothetical protein
VPLALAVAAGAIALLLGTLIGYLATGEPDTPPFATLERPLPVVTVTTPARRPATTVTLTLTAPAATVTVTAPGGRTTPAPAPTATTPARTGPASTAPVPSTRR